MKPSARLRLDFNVRDRELIDRDDNRCGIVDDVELEGEPGQPLRVKNLLIGAGAYVPRLPHSLRPLMAAIAGRRIVRIPWNEVDEITAHVRLKGRAAEYGLRKAEERVSRWIAKIPFA